MKKFLFKSLSVFMAMVLLFAQNQTLSAKTIDTELPSIDESVFNLDEDALDLAMQGLNELEYYLISNEGVTYDDLLASNNDLIDNVSNLSVPMGMAQDGEPPLGIPSFLWGCVFGWIGLLVVFLVTDNDKEQVKKALYGCITSGVVTGAIYLVLILTLDTSYY